MSTDWSDTHRDWTEPTGCCHDWAARVADCAFWRGHQLPRGERQEREYTTARSIDDLSVRWL